MPTEQNPYEAIPVEPDPQPAGRRQLSLLESIAAFTITLIVFGATLFATCIGCIGIGISVGKGITGNETLDTVLMLFVWVGVPTLAAAAAGRFTLKWFVHAVTAMRD